MSKEKTMTYEQLVAECKRLRGVSERAEAEFFAFLMRADREYEDVWRGNGCVSFRQFMTSNHLRDPDRYLFFAKGVDNVGLDAALANGAPWTIEIGRAAVKDQPMVIEGLVERAAAFVETERVAPARMTVESWSRELLAPERQHQTIQKADELHRLRAENQKLKAELAAAKARIAELESMVNPPPPRARKKKPVPA